MGTVEERPTVNIDRAKAVTTGYMSEPELEWLAIQAQKYTRIVEVGSWTGRSTLALADNTSGLVIAVDTWEGCVNGDLQDILAVKGKSWAWQEFKRNIIHTPNIIPVMVKSVIAARAWQEFDREIDFVFIDGSHDYHSVCEDILEWKRWVRLGGMLAGHDYTVTRPHCIGVVQAVDELLPHRQLMQPNDGEHSIWWVNV